MSTEFDLNDPYTANYRASHTAAQSRSREWTQAKLAWARMQLENVERDLAGWRGRVDALDEALNEKDEQEEESA